MNHSDFIKRMNSNTGKTPTGDSKLDRFLGNEPLTICVLPEISEVFKDRVSSGQLTILSGKLQRLPQCDIKGWLKQSMRPACPAFELENLLILINELEFYDLAQSVFSVLNLDYNLTFDCLETVEFFYEGGVISAPIYFENLPFETRIGDLFEVLESKGF